MGLLEQRGRMYEAEEVSNSLGPCTARKLNVEVKL